MLLFAQMGFGQAIKDNAVIPVSITLNSILRLTVTSGGNIQFVVNTIDQYTGGISNQDQYTTMFTVSSSRDFIVEMYAEDATFVGQETGLTMDLDFLRFTMAGTGPSALAGLNPLTAAGSATEIVGTSGTPADAGGQLDYEILWELGTEAGNSLLEANLPADIYITNVFLSLVPQ